MFLFAFVALSVFYKTNVRKIVVTIAIPFLRHDGSL